MTSYYNLQAQAQDKPQTQTGQPRIIKWVIYYALLLAATLLGMAYGYVFSQLFFPSNGEAVIETVLNLLKLFWIIPLPYAIINFFSFMRYPIFVRTPPEAPVSMPDLKLYFRVVTRGMNPTLVAETVEAARVVLGNVLPDDVWIVEVVTDNDLPIANINTEVIVVPTSYETENKTRYKGRALHYALTASSARPQDWIIHLDEETQFDEDTVLTILNFAIEQHEAVRRGERRFAKIGQGIIVYGKLGIKNWITTLADSLRVGDDYGRFRLQFEHGKAHFGIHGSFIVMNNAFEQHMGFDHGPRSSITEDAYFALLAQAEGAEFAFLHTFMYERSPFSIIDFLRQRRRWFGGLWMCTLAPDIPLRQRLILGSFMILWSISWLCLMMVYVNLFFPTGTPVWIAICGGLSFLYFVTLYVVGFVRTFDRQSLGKQYYVLLLAQILLIPLFSAMESGGVIYGLISPVKDFYIVQKES